MRAFTSKILKKIDSCSAGVFVALMRGSKKKELHLSKIGTILFIRPGGIGDAVCLLPVINQIKKSYPQCRIDILAEKRNAEVFYLAKNIGNIYRYDVLSEFVRCLANKYDVVIDTEQWHRLSAVVARLIRADLRIGFGTNERSKLFNLAIGYSHQEYEPVSFMSLIMPLVGNSEKKYLKSPLIVIDTHDINAILQKFSLDLTRPYVCIVPGASVEERRWGGDKFGKVALSIAQKSFEIVIIGTHSDKQDARLIKQHVSNAIDLTGKTNLSDAAAIMAGSRLVISPDSGLMHLAAALNVPTVTLFGSGIEAKWGHTGDRNIIINKQVPCSPCTKFGYTPKCSNDLVCLKNISVNDVLVAFNELIGV